MAPGYTNTWSWTTLRGESLRTNSWHPEETRLLGLCLRNERSPDILLALLRLGLQSELPGVNLNRKKHGHIQ
jgi:hypothetical protein